MSAAGLQDSLDVDVPTLAGSLLISALINWGLLGVLCVQTYTYYVAFPKDRLLANVLVYGTLVLEVAQTVIISHDTMSALASSFGDKQALNAMRTHWLTIPVSGGITGCIGQLFFAYRIAHMSDNNKKVPILIILLSVASGCSAMVAAAQFFNARNFTMLKTTTLAAVGIWNGLGAICDIIIAVFMPYYILRKGSGLPSTHAIIIKLMSLIIETGILTACVALAHLILYFLFTEAFIVPGGALSKVYANTMLMILNNRIRIVGGRVDHNESMDRRDSDAFKNPTTSSRSRIHVSNDRLTFKLDEITMQTDVQRKVDSDPIAEMQFASKSSSSLEYNPPRRSNNLEVPKRSISPPFHSSAAGFAV